jgi:NADH:ubiquinone oxidoreductase subunit 6 (subunit J)
VTVQAGVQINTRWQVVSAIAVTVSILSLTCFLSFESVNQFVSQAQSALNGVALNPKTTTQELMNARAQFAKVASVLKAIQLIWFVGAYAGLFISVIALVGRNQRWHSKPILSIVAFYLSLVVVMTTMPPVLLVLYVELFGPMH